MLVAARPPARPGGLCIQLCGAARRGSAAKQTAPMSACHDAVLPAMCSTRGPPGCRRDWYATSTAASCRPTIAQQQHRRRRSSTSDLRPASKSGLEIGHTMIRLVALVLAALARPSPVDGASSHAGVCDAINVCDLEIYDYECPPGMELVAPPTRSNKYTLRTADGDDGANDPTEYTPGFFFDLHLRTLDADYKCAPQKACDRSAVGARSCLVHARGVPQKKHALVHSVRAFAASSIPRARGAGAARRRGDRSASPPPVSLARSATASRRSSLARARSRRIASS